jgi:hypothetical protein
VEHGALRQVQNCNMHPTKQVHCTYFQIKIKPLLAMNFAPTLIEIKYHAPRDAFFWTSRACLPAVLLGWSAWLGGIFSFT